MKKIIFTLFILAFACIAAFSQSKFSEKKVKDKIESIKKQKQDDAESMGASNLVDVTIDAYVIHTEELTRVGNIYTSMLSWKRQSEEHYKSILTGTATPTTTRTMPEEWDGQQEYQKDKEYVFDGSGTNPSFLLVISPLGELLSWTIKSTMVTIKNDMVFVRKDMVVVYENSLGEINGDFIPMVSLEDFPKYIYKYKQTGFLYVASQWKYREGTMTDYRETDHYSPVDL